MNDALGNPIIVGNKYGYTSKKGSWITVVVGRITSVTDGKVRMQPSSVQTHLYGKPSTYNPQGMNARSINPFSLFPVAD